MVVAVISALVDMVMRTHRKYFTLRQVSYLVILRIKYEIYKSRCGHNSVLES
jgi:hypothetical protein